MWALTQAVQEQNFFLPLNADIIQKKKKEIEKSWNISTTSPTSEKSLSPAK